MIVFRHETNKEFIAGGGAACREPWQGRFSINFHSAQHVQAGVLFTTWSNRNHNRRHSSKSCRTCIPATDEFLELFVFCFTLVSVISPSRRGLNAARNTTKIERFWKLIFHSLLFLSRLDIEVFSSSDHRRALADFRTKWGRRPQHNSEADELQTPLVGSNYPRSSPLPHLHL